MKLKRDISGEPVLDEPISKVLSDLHNTPTGFKVPEGYFDSLNSRIVDTITNREKISSTKYFLQSFHKPLIWAPALAVLLIGIVIIFTIPLKSKAPVPVADEWTEINMAYDASYAAEAILSESHLLDNAVEIEDVNYKDHSFLSGKNTPSKEEITKFIQDHDLETELLIEY